MLGMVKKGLGLIFLQDLSAVHEQHPAAHLTGKAHLMGDHHPVSYTHLDVYKRQEYQGPHQLRKFAYLSIAFWKIKEAPSFTLCKNLVVISKREWKTQPSAAKERT